MTTILRGYCFLAVQGLTATWGPYSNLTATPERGFRIFLTTRARLLRN
jgi:hypothetical protein